MALSLLKIPNVLETDRVERVFEFICKPYVLLWTRSVSVRFIPVLGLSFVVNNTAPTDAKAAKIKLPAIIFFLPNLIKRTGILINKRLVTYFSKGM